MESQITPFTKSHILLLLEEIVELVILPFLKLETLSSLAACTCVQRYLSQ